jgi:hypothetical protein
MRNYFNRYRDNTERPQFGSSFRPHTTPADSTKLPPRKRDSNRHTASVAKNPKQELPISEEEFKRHVFTTKMDLIEKGKIQGSAYSQCPKESNSLYHCRIYNEARSYVRSEIRAAEAEK